MTGRVKMFNQSKGFGFIVGADNNDYFFHTTNIQSGDAPYTGMNVEFLASNGTKGLVAKEIKPIVAEKGNRPAFFRCGNTRIRLSNIKDYSIEMLPCAYIAIFDLSLKECGKLPVYWDHGNNDGAEFFDEVQGRTIVTDVGRIVRTAEGKLTHYESKYEDMRDFREWIPSECLVIKTYQEDKFVFFRDIEARTGIEIHDKLEELDSYFA